MRRWLCRLILVSLVGMLLTGGIKNQRSTFGATTRQRVPTPTVKMKLYRHVGTRWVASTHLHEGDRLLLVLLYRWNVKPSVDNQGRYRPSANLVIRKNTYPYVEFHPRVGYQGVLFISPSMHRTRLPNGFKRFHLEVDLPRHAPGWVGRLQFEFQVTDQTGEYGVSIYPTLTVAATTTGTGSH